MRRKGSSTASCLAGAALALAMGCAPNDLGAPCHLLRADNTEASPRAGHTTVQSGSGECEQFTCASFEGRPAVCTRACDVEGESCEEGWTCRQALLGPEMLAQVRDRTEGRDEDGDGVDDFAQIVTGLSDALLCAPP